MWQLLRCALLAVGASHVAGAAPAGRTATPAAAAPRISGPYVYENLDVYLVHGPGIEPTEARRLFRPFHKSGGRRVLPSSATGVRSVEHRRVWFKLVHHGVR